MSEQLSPLVTSRASNYSIFITIYFIGAFPPIEEELDLKKRVQESMQRTPFHAKIAPRSLHWNAFHFICMKSSVIIVQKGIVQSRCQNNLQLRYQRIACVTPAV